MLVVDDDRSVIVLVKRALKDLDLEVLSADSAARGAEVIRDQGSRLDVCLLDIMLPDTSGIDACAEYQAIDPTLPIIFITSDDSSDTAIEATKMGAYDHVLKPLNVPELKALVEKAREVRRKMLVPVEMTGDIAPKESSDLIVGRSPAMQEVYKAVGRVATQGVTVLIRGESGTGKELIARAIYQHGDRSDRPFLTVNCAAIPETLLESELFGHEKGAFTGAERRRIGKFEQCSGGTIFLDEIGDMPQMLQTKILRLLQYQRFERVGGNETIQSDVRIIAATNRDLETAVEEKTFREDLYYRLKGFEIELPPLRERPEDVEILIRHFLARFGRELGKEVTSISADAMELLLKHTWPGNVRELENVIKQMLIETTGSVLVADLVPDFEDARRTPASESLRESEKGSLESFIAERLAAGSDDLYAESIERLERHLITSVLKQTSGNQSQAAKILGITRGSLRNKIRSLDIEISAVVRDPEADDGATGSD